MINSAQINNQNLFKEYVIHKKVIILMQSNKIE